MGIIYLFDFVGVMLIVKDEIRFGIDLFDFVRVVDEWLENTLVSPSAYAVT